MKVLAILAFVAMPAFGGSFLGDLPVITPEQECARTEALASVSLGISLADPAFQKIDCSRPQEDMEKISNLFLGAEKNAANQKGNEEGLEDHNFHGQPYCRVILADPARNLVTPLIKGNRTSCPQSCKNAVLTQCAGTGKTLNYYCDLIDPQAQLKVVPLTQNLNFRCDDNPTAKMVCRYNGVEQGLFPFNQTGEAQCAQKVFANKKFSRDDYKKNCFTADGLPVQSGTFDISISVDLGGKSFNSKPYEFTQNCSALNSATSKNPIVPNSLKSKFSR